MCCQTDVRMENGKAWPERRLTDERIRIVKNVEIQRIDVVREQDDRVEESDVLKNEIRRRLKVLALKNDDGHQTRQDSQDCQRKDNAAVNASVIFVELSE